MATSYRSSPNSLFLTKELAARLRNRACGSCAKQQGFSRTTCTRLVRSHIPINDQYRESYLPRLEVS